MQLTTLNDRIKNIEDRINKKEKTIANKTKLLTKKEKIVLDAGYNLNDTNYAKQDPEIMWTLFDIDQLKEDLIRLPKEVEKLRENLEYYKQQLIDANKIEFVYVNEIPESMKLMESELIKEWVKFDIERRDKIKEDKRTKSFKDVMNKYSRYEWNTLVYKSDLDIYKDNEKDAKAFVLNLYNRIKEITGDVIDWSGIHLNYGARGTSTLNGIITGVKGKCKVESIFAEGPIQKLHVRVLTKEIN